MRTFLRWTALILALLAVLIAAALTFVVFSPGPLVESLAPRFLKALPFSVELGQVSGNLLSGLTFENVHIDHPQARVDVDRLHVRLAWPALLHKTVKLTAIELDRPRIALKNAPAEPEKPTTEKSAWVIRADPVRITNGSVQTAQVNNSTPTRVENINAVLGYDSDRVRIDSTSLQVQGSTVDARGTVQLTPLSFDMAAQTQGLFDGKLSIKGSTSIASGELNGTWKGATIGGHAQLRYQDWRATVTISGLDPHVLSSSATSRLGLLSGNLSAAGTGFVPATMTARGTLAVATTNGPRIKGEVSISNGTGQWNAKISSGGIDALTTGRIAIKDLQLDTRLSATLTPQAVREWVGSAEAAVSVNATLKGKWPNVEWSVKSNLSNAKFSGGSVAAVAINGRGQRLPPQTMDIGVSAKTIAISSNTFDSADVHVTGSLAAHQASIQIRSPQYSLDSEGRGGLIDTTWNMQWSKFNLHAIQNWTLARPFTSSIAASRVTLTNFQLVDSSAQVHADIDLRNNTFALCRIQLRGFNIANLSNVGLIAKKVSGLAQADLTLQGPASKPTGEATFRLTDLHIEDNAVGTLDGHGRFSTTEIEIYRSTLTTAAGIAGLAGTLDLSNRPGRIPEFDVLLTATNLDLGPLLKQFPVTIESSLLNANVKIIHRNRSFTAKGPLSLTAKQIDLSDHGVRLSDVVIDMMGDGDSLRIKQGRAQTGTTKKNKGTLTLDGVIRRSDNAVYLRTKNFSFDSDLGVTGKMDIDLGLKGSIDEPLIAGNINITKADLLPARKEKADKARAKREKKENKGKEIAKPATPPAPETPSALNLDLHVGFDNNVWYKEKQTAIEAKGDLSIEKQSYQNPRIVGTITTIRGDYVFYGRTFKVQHGNIRFLGEDRINPTLDIQAIYEEPQSKTKVILDVSGDLDQPIVTLSSDPALEQTDIISILVTGKPLDDFGQAQKSDNDSGALAKTVVANYFAEELRQQLQSTAQIDVLRFNVNENQEADITVGKNLSNRLYVGYGQTLGPSGERRVEAQYSLGHHWGLEGYTGSEGTYVIDLLYKLGLK